MGRFIFKMLIVLVLCLMGGSVFSFYSLLYKQNEAKESTVFVIEKGEYLNQIARRLKEQQLLNSIAVFKVAAKLLGQGTAIKAGEYNLPPRASAKELLEILVEGKTTLRRVVIPEGKTSKQVYDMLMQSQGLLGDLPEPPPNGTLLPETYSYSYGMPRQVLADRMKTDMQKTIEELWPKREEGLPYDTIEEALVLASIVEKETSIADERARIAGVFVNRLRKGMRLQTDPTVIYAVTDGSMELKRRLTLKDLRQPHPFNTYTNAGLPPAPICNPGRESIYAVLHPAKTDEFYFVADGTGGHSFSKTFGGHRRNIRNWKNAKKRKAYAKKKKYAPKKKTYVKKKTYTPKKKTTAVAKKPAPKKPAPVVKKSAPVTKTQAVKTPAPVTTKSAVKKTAPLPKKTAPVVTPKTVVPVVAKKPTVTTAPVKQTSPVSQPTAPKAEASSLSVR